MSPGGSSAKPSEAGGWPSLAQAPQRLGTGGGAGRIRQRSDTTNLAAIETDTAERAEGYLAADAVLVSHLDSETFAAGRAPCAIKVQQRSEHDGRSKGARYDRYVAVRRADAACQSEERHGGYGNEPADSQRSARALRPSLEVFPDRQAHHVPGSYRAHPAEAREMELTWV